MSKILFADTYPFIPGKLDAIVLVSRAALPLGNKLVLLPPYPTVDMLGEGENEYYRLITVTEGDIPEGITAIEVSPESFMALGTSNANKVEVPEPEEVKKAMTKEDSLQRDWNADMFDGKGGSSEDSD
jgi:hypothetical protein